MPKRLPLIATIVLALTASSVNFAAPAAPARVFTITASAGNGGSVSPSGQVSVPEGGNQKFTFISNAGFHISGVFVNGVPKGVIGSYTFTNVTGDQTISVSFKQNSGGAGQDAEPTLPPFVPTQPPIPTPQPTQTPQPTPVPIPTQLPASPTPLPEAEELEWHLFPLTNGAGAVVKNGSPPQEDEEGFVYFPDGGTVITKGYVEIELSPGSEAGPDGRLWIVEDGAGVGAAFPGGLAFSIRNEATIFLDEIQPFGYRVEIVNPFADVVESDWFYNFVMFAYAHRAMNGSGTLVLRFNPSDDITRGMAATLLHNIAGTPQVNPYSQIPFADVAWGDWYANPLRWAASEGIAFADRYGNFYPERPITRQDLMLMFERFVRSRGIELPVKRNYTGFADESEISGEAMEAAVRFYRAGIINGKSGNRFDPRGEATRAEVSTMIYLMLEAIGEATRT